MSSIKSVKDFIEQIQTYQSEYYNLNLKKTDNEVTFFYRGQSQAIYDNIDLSDSKKKYSIIPSLFHKNDIISREYEVFQEMLRIDPDSFENQKSYLDIHKEMQHYAEISRVIDITKQALTALFFAVSEFDGKEIRCDCCYEKIQIDSKNEHVNCLRNEGNKVNINKTNPHVFIFSVENIKIKRPESDGTQIKLAIAAIKEDKKKELEKSIQEYQKNIETTIKENEKFNKSIDELFWKSGALNVVDIIPQSITDKKLKRYIKKTIEDVSFNQSINDIIKKYYREIFNQEEAVKKLVYAVRKNDGILEDIHIPEDIKKVEFVLPTMNNKRITAQQGAFIAVGLLDQEELYKEMNQYLTMNNESKLMMIEIDFNSAYKIKLELEQLGITSSALFPDIHKLGQNYKKQMALDAKSIIEKLEKIV